MPALAGLRPVLHMVPTPPDSCSGMGPRVGNPCGAVLASHLPFIQLVGHFSLTPLLYTILTVLYVGLVLADKLHPNQMAVAQMSCVAFS